MKQILYSLLATPTSVQIHFFPDDNVVETFKEIIDTINHQVEIKEPIFGVCNEIDKEDFNKHLKIHGDPINLTLSTTGRWCSKFLPKVGIAIQAVVEQIEHIESTTKKPVVLMNHVDKIFSQRTICQGFPSFIHIPIELEICSGGCGIKTLNTKE